jgi:rhodanese-related sulfurtransferase
MKKTIILIMLFINSFIASSGAQYSKTASCQDPAFDKKVDSYLSYSVPVLGVQEAFDKRAELTFLDAREFDEYSVSHIPGSRYVGYDKFKIETIKDIPRDKKIVVYCSIGYRSEIVATKLKNAGYKNIYNLYGSLFEWANEGHDMADKNGKSTQKVHTFNKKWSEWVLNPALVKVWK